MGQTLYTNVDTLKGYLLSRLVLIAGLRASGRTTLGKELESLGAKLISLDQIRQELIEGGKHPGQAPGVALERVRDALAGEHSLVVVEGVELGSKARKPYIEIARAHGQPVEIVLLDVPFMTCLARRRKDRIVDKQEIAALRDVTLQLQQVALPGRDVERLKQLQPGEERLTALRPTDKPGHYAVVADDAPLLVLIEKPPALNSRQLLPEPPFRKVVPGKHKLDLIGDTHGCIQEPLMLLEKLGYRLALTEENGLPRLLDVEAPEGRKLLFLGDLVDKGPNSAQLLALVMQLVKFGVAIVIMGNHDHKLMRVLGGASVEIKPYLQATIEQIDRHGPAFRKQVLDFLLELPLIWENDEIRALHGGYREVASGETAMNLALYGEPVPGQFDERGFPLRSEKWKEEYKGSKHIYCGHTPVAEPVVHRNEHGAEVVCIDTGCALGDELTAVRWPEKQIFTVRALQTYFADRSVDNF